MNFASGGNHLRCLVCLDGAPAILELELDNGGSLRRRFNQHNLTKPTNEQNHALEILKRDASVAEEIEDKPVAKPRLQAAVNRTFSGCPVCSALALGWWWDTEPEHFDVGTTALATANAKQQQMVTGYITTTTVIQLADTYSASAVAI